MNLTPCNACKASGGITASKSSSSVRAVCLPALNSTFSSMLRASPARGQRPYSPGGSGHRPIAGFGECEIWASTDRWCIFCDTVKFREQRKTPAQAQLAFTHPTSPRAHEPTTQPSRARTAHSTDSGKSHENHGKPSRTRGQAQVELMMTRPRTRRPPRSASQAPYRA